MSVSSPISIDELLESGNERLVANDAEGAKPFYIRALQINPECVPALMNLATVSMRPGHTAATIALLERVVALDPKNGSAWSSLGGAYWRAERFRSADVALARARELAPNWIVEYRSGLLAYAMGDADASEIFLRRALDAKPDQASLALDYAHTVLKQGDLARGLELFESRWAAGLEKNAIWYCGKPLWTGERIQGGSLLLHHEQGFGDTIQFCRFIPEIKRLAGCEIVFAAPPQLHGLLEGQCAIDRVVSLEDDVYREAENAAYHCPLISAVSALKPTYATLPPGKPYLDAYPLPPLGLEKNAELAVGLCWSASSTPWTEQRKSIALEALLTLGAVPGVKLWSLQFGGQPLAASGADALISEIPGGVGDFARTAAIIDQLDAVVSIDSATAHLAAALGTTTLMLNPYFSCWRWTKGAHPWYADMTIFQQPKPGDWALPIAEVKRHLELLVGNIE